MMERYFNYLSAAFMIDSIIRDQLVLNLCLPAVAGTVDSGVILRTYSTNCLEYGCIEL